MKPAATLVLLLACSLVAVGTNAASCCGFTQSGNSYYGPGSYTPSVGYTKNRDGSPISVSGGVSVQYSSSCGDCITASFSLASRNNCTFEGNLPNISGYTCKYYLSSISEFTDHKLSRKNIPCVYSSYITTDVNRTHYKSCTVNYVGVVARAEFDASSPKGKAKVECHSLYPSPASCYVSQIY